VGIGTFSKKIFGFGFWGLTHAECPVTARADSIATKISGSGGAAAVWWIRGAGRRDRCLLTARLKPGLEAGIVTTLEVALSVHGNIFQKYFDFGDCIGETLLPTVWVSMVIGYPPPGVVWPFIFYLLDTSKA